MDCGIKVGVSQSLAQGGKEKEVVWVVLFLPYVSSSPLCKYLWHVLFTHSHWHDDIITRISFNS